MLCSKYKLTGEGLFTKQYIDVWKERHVSVFMLDHISINWGMLSLTFSITADLCVSIDCIKTTSLAPH
jgi:hypothetical protein